MLFLVKLFPEITIKSRPVRKRQTRQLRKNLRRLLATIDPEISVSGELDSIEVATGGGPGGRTDAIREQLAATPGISLFLEADKFPLPDLDGILALADAAYGNRLADRSFAVRCKRSGRHTFSSIDVERHVGAGLKQAHPSARVQLVDPEVTVALEVRQEALYVVKQTHRGLGGYPLGCQEPVLSLISGGYDSAVSSFLCMRRGLTTHYCFFNLGGREHELAVKEVALFLWTKYHRSHRVRFVSVPFEPVVEAILTRVDNAHMGIVLKRMMLKAASQVAAQLDIKALVTGESVGQVSSQTLGNLAVIDSVSDVLVLRPLIASDKQEIINQARTIGTESFSRGIPEYCAVISQNPVTKARPDRVAREEARLDPNLVDEAVARAHYQLITDLVEQAEEISTTAPAIVNAAEPDATIIDIRHPDEIDLQPFNLSIPPGAELLAIPFYRLRGAAAQLPQSRRLLLYCRRGMLSRLHAATLKDLGFTDVAVLDPEAEERLAG